MATSPLPDLTIAFAPVPSQIEAALRTNLRVVVSNIGDGTATGKVVIGVTGNGATLTHQTVMLRIKPGAHKTFIVHFVEPDSPSQGVSPDGIRLDLAATVNAKNTIAEQNGSNNTATASQVAVESVAQRRWVHQHAYTGDGSWWWF